MTDSTFDSRHKVFNLWLGRWVFVNAVMNRISTAWHDVLFDPESRVRPESEFPGVRRCRLSGSAMRGGSLEPVSRTEEYNEGGYLTRVSGENLTWTIAYRDQCILENIRIIDENQDFLYDERRFYDAKLRLVRVDAKAYDPSNRLLGKPIADTHAKVFGNEAPTKPVFAVKQHTVYTFDYDEHDRLISMGTTSDVHPGNPLAEPYKSQRIENAYKGDVDAFYVVHNYSKAMTLFFEFDDDTETLHVTSTHSKEHPMPDASIAHRLIRASIFGKRSRIKLCSVEKPGLYREELFSLLPIDGFDEVAQRTERRVAQFGTKSSGGDVKEVVTESDYYGQTSTDKINTFSYDDEGRVTCWFQQEMVEDSRYDPPKKYPTRTLTQSYAYTVEEYEVRETYIPTD